MNLPFTVAFIFLLAAGISLCYNDQSDPTVIKRPDYGSDGGHSSNVDGNIRLPGNLVPLSYILYLHPNITDGKFQYTGDVTILFEVKDETDVIILHSLDIRHLYTTVNEMADDSVKITEDSKFGKTVRIKKTTKNHELEQANIQLDTKLTKGKKYSVHIIFTAPLRSGLRGFYKSSYTTNKGEKRFIATSHFEPTGARLAFPCFDEPTMKATFTVRVVREKQHTALSNMPVDNEVVRRDGLVTVFFKESVKMSTYLVAFVVCDFVHLSSRSSRGIEVKVWAPADQIPQASYAMEITPKILDYYEKFFKVDFPLPKLDLIGVPDFGAGAMENWGLITYRLTNFLYDEKKSTALNKQRVAMVVAHELAHQWFGNLVTMKWWQDIWLNEGFAAFTQYLGTNLAGPKFGVFGQFISKNVQVAMGVDSHNHSHPIFVPVTDPKQIGSLFDPVTYLKGSSLINMMRNFMGHDKFTTGISHYLNKYKFSNAESDDLWACLSEAMGKSEVNVKEVMDTWITQVGYPVINIQKNGDKAVLTQERFITDAEVSKVEKWNIPLVFYYQNNKQKKKSWFKTTQKEINLSYDSSLGWLKMNADEIGFYRVNYDEENWKALTKQLNDDHTALSPADRSNLIDDAFQLALAGKLRQTQALEMTEYLNKETEFLPFNAATVSLSFLGDMLYSRPGYDSYQKYVIKKLAPIIKKLGWKDEGTHMDKLLRGVVMEAAVRYNDKESVKKAVQMFDDWMLKDITIPVNLQEIVFYAGMKYGSEKHWNFMYNLYQKSRIPTEKVLLMYSLAQTSNPVLLKKYLEETLNNDVIKSQDTCYLIHKIALNPIGQRMSYEFILKNWPEFIKRYGTGINFRQLVQLFTGIFGGGKTQQELNEATDFLNYPLGGGKLSLVQSIDNIRMHMRWLSRNEKVVVEWLTSKTKY